MKVQRRMWVRKQVSICRVRGLTSVGSSEETIWTSERIIPTAAGVCGNIHWLTCCTPTFPFEGIKSSFMAKLCCFLHQDAWFL